MSAILSAQDLNDFIGPGLACINPVVVNKSDNAGHTEIRIDATGNPVEVSLDGDANAAPQTTSLTPAQINLSDCLACSGCVTSAESVLISLQSHTELLSVLRAARAKSGGEVDVEMSDATTTTATTEHKKLFAVSISHQSRASLAAAFNIPVAAVDAKLATLFKDILGFQYMVGTGVGRQISLTYSAREVLVNSGRMSKASGATDTDVVDFSSMRISDDDSEKSATKSNTQKKPIISSACPGWICYVEKTHPHIIPHLSAIKSPQQITGSLLKRLIARENPGICESEIYHVSVMPCFDKKLEASRKDFASCENVKDVDCVITTKEVVQLLLDENIDFMGIKETPAEEMLGTLKSMAPGEWPVEQSWESNEGSSSGGYLHHVLSSIAQHAQKTENRQSSVKAVPGKNSDMVEYHLLDTSTGEVIAKAAQVYGFRNIQNLVRKLKLPGKGNARAVVSRRRATTAAVATMNPAEYDYIEVMACPGGCINGGGQIGAPAESGSSEKDWRETVEAAYRTIASAAVDDDGVAGWVDRVWAGPAEAESVERLVETGYRAVEGFDANVMPAVLVGDKW
ncbi:cytosolic Fe-S cluster assembly factor NAR1 [Myxozyma melibiosi]|uniref:Cytosolic Fe-S cluster assembly factor NAR1 n=1 Tax=Myxozyma melibiosi TaxID=54550 RepID=A0ABR1F0R7_9ASCO